MHALPSLRVIQLGTVVPDQRSLELLNCEVFAKRKDITLRVYAFSDLWSEISFLHFLPDVERFDWDVDLLGSVEPLKSLKKLKHIGLGLTQPKPKIDLHFLLDFRNTLESVNLSGDYKNTRAVIPKIDGLRSAWFASTKLSDFDFLADLPIETLGNYGGRVQSFDSVRKLTTLKKIWLKTNAKLEGLDFVEQLSNLERIELYYLAKITRFPSCDLLKNLKLVFAFECNRLSDISELQKLSGVKVHVSGKALPNRSYQTEDFSLAEL